MRLIALTLLVVSSLVATTSSSSQELNSFFSAEIFSDSRDVIGALENSGSIGRLSWFGFYENKRKWNTRANGWIVVLEPKFQVTMNFPLDGTIFNGFTSDGYFASTGGRLRLTNVPSLSELTQPFEFLAITYLHTIHGLPFNDELVLEGGTKPFISFGGVGNINLSGFYRIRINDTNFGQQQVMLNFTEVFNGMSVGVEFETVDEDPLPRLGIRYIHKIL